MKLKISNRASLLNKFLLPISKIVDSVVLKIESGRLSALVATSDSTIVVNAEYIDTAIDSNVTLNIPDIKKFCRIIQCIDKDVFDLEISTNNISYASNTVRFKYHLYDDNIITVPKLNMSKLEKLEFDSTFELTQQSIDSLIKGSTIATDSNKIYISVNDNELIGELTDKARANTDSYGMVLSTNYDGVQLKSPIPLNFEIFRIISSIKFDSIKGKLVSTRGVITLEINSDNTKLTFVISALAN